jgi:CelD/BcsL family acetyltransferase involved in cellulose biosynthesis
MIDTLVDQKSRAFARMGQPNLFARPGHIEFYRALACAGDGKGIVHVSALRVGSDIAAANLGLSFRGCYHHHLASHGDGHLSRFGPGIFHLHELMRHAIESGCTSFDFTIGDEPYKRDWCDGAQELYDYVSVITWRGAFAYLRTIVFLSLKRLIKRTPVLWSFFTRARAQIGGVR